MSPSKIFRSYIGARPKSKFISFNDVPIQYQELEYHFIIAFARDYDRIDNRRLNGEFQRYWNTFHLNHKTVRKIREKHHNVKVFLSIGSTEDNFPFDPRDKDSWIRNAVQTVGNLVNENNLDGVDVNYHKILTTPDVFAECIGELIKTLKDKKVIDFASIAPSTGVDKNYLALYRKKQYRECIDFVNYQFYTRDRPMESVALFVKRVEEKINNVYTDGNFLVGLSTDKKFAGKLQEDVFFRGWKQLENKLKGIFIWCADDSSPGFEYERMAQKLMTMVSKSPRCNEGLSSYGFGAASTSTTHYTSSSNRSIQERLESLLSSGDDLDGQGPRNDGDS